MKKIINIEILVRNVLDSLLTKKFNIKTPDYSLVINQNQNFGDYSINIAHLINKDLGVSIYEAAQIITNELLKRLPEKIFSKINTEKNGFINLWISKKYLFFISKFISEEERPFQNFNSDEKIYIVEFSSPDMVKPFTVGYLRSTIIGDSIARILTYCGKKVIRDNHIGDWGIQFGRLLVAIKEWSSLDNIKNHTDPYSEIINLYYKFTVEAKENESLNEKASSLFKELESGDTELLSILTEIKTILFERLSSIYSRLNVHFDVISWESLYKDESKKLVQNLITTGIAQKSAGAVIIKYDSDTPPLLLEKSNGSTLYAAREISCDLHRKQLYGESLVIINEVGNDQNLYFKQIFEAEYTMKLFKPEQRIHLSHGMYKLDGLKIISESKSYLEISTVLDYIKKSIFKKIPGTSTEDCEVITQGSVKFGDLKNPHTSDIIFDIENFTNEGKGTGLYIQKTIHRARLLAKEAIKLKNEKLEEQDFNEQEVRIFRHLQKFYKFLELATSNLDCHYVAQYSTELASLYNYYHQNTLKNDKNKNGLVLLISSSTDKLLSLCLELLNIKVPSKI